MKKIVTVTLIAIVALVLTGCQSQDMDNGHTYIKATSEIEVVESEYLDSFKELVEEAMAEEGIEVLDTTIACGWMNGPWITVHVYAEGDQYLLYRVGNVSGPLVLALQGDPEAKAEMIRCYGVDDLSYWEAEVDGDEIVLIDPVVPGWEDLQAMQDE